MTHNHFEGYTQARLDLLAITDKAELLATLDALYGRKDLDESDSLEDIMQECLRQQERDWRMEPTFGSV